MPNKQRKLDKYAREITGMIMLRLIIQLQRISMDPELLQILGIDAQRTQQYHELLNTLHMHLMGATLLLLERPWWNETPDQKAMREAVAIEYRKAASELRAPDMPKDDAHARGQSMAELLEAHCNKISKLEQMFSVVVRQKLRTRKIDGVSAAVVEMVTPYEMAAVCCVQALGVRRRHEEQVLHILQRGMHALRAAVVAQVQAPPPNMWQRAREWMKRRWWYGRKWQEREAEKILSALFE